VNGIVYFTANNGTNGIELWKTDGTTAGTALVKDVTAGSTSTSFGSLLDFDGTLFFATLTDLWKSDGTDAGTVVVHDIDPAALIVMDHTLYIGSGELWKSDGTTAGTVLVKDIRPGSANSNPSAFARVGSTLFFAATASSNIGEELWKSDGTAAGTVFVKDIRPGTSQSSSPRNLVDANGTLFFTADDGVHGRELWKSDGTAAGTVLVKDIGPYETTIVSSTFTPVGSVVVFSGDDGTSGREPWISDGTPEGTRMLANIAPMGSSSPRAFKRVGDLLYFRALTNAIGGELYAVPIAALTDADLDGLLDTDERALGTDEFDADTDDDGLSDGAEVNTHGTDPLLADTDGDGFSDSAEIDAGSDPLDPQSVPPAVPVGGLWVYGVLAAGLIATARRRLGRAAVN
jgi:ELWxxDGT repeat protein